MNGKYVLGIDQSTQGTKALLFDRQGKLFARCDRSHAQIINEQGWVEHDPEEIYQNVLNVVKDVVEKARIDKKEIAVVGISNQRETAMIWDKKTGRKVYNAIVWQCARGEGICRQLQEQGYGEKIKAVTGLPLSPYFSAAKLAWILENVEGVQKKSKQNELCFGTMDSWLVFKLTGNKSFKTDYSNASRTQLFNITELTWEKEICQMFGINYEGLPEVCDSDANYGETDFDGYLDRPIPIHAVFGDSHGALFGQGCQRTGMIKSTYGTGSSVMMNVGEKPIFSKKGIVTSLAWGMNGKVNYVLEGNINYTGAVISWLKNDMKIIANAQETQKLAESANSQDRTYFVPAFTGIGAPYWDSNATGLFTGITRITGRAEIVRAALDCIAYQIADIVALMGEESGMEIKEIRVDGGPTKNTYLMQFQSNILGISVQVPDVEELSGMGAAYAAAIAVGLYDSEQAFSQINRIKYEQKMDEEKSKALYVGWKQAVGRALSHE